MEQSKFLKLFSLIAFIAFAAVSCWATAESLHLLLPSWPAVMCWIVTVGFFVIASIGTKMIVDSLNQNIYLEKRGLRLIGGIIVVLLFWLVCSMPTNAHTFFYRTSITDIVTQDLSTTKNYLQKLHDNIKTEDEIKTKQKELTSKINAELTALENEIDNLANPGFGDRAKSHLDKIALTLQVGSIPTLSYKGTSPQQIKLLKQQYRTLVYQLLEKRNEEIANNIRNSQEAIYKPVAEKQIKDIEAMEKKITDMHAQGHVDNDVIARTDLALKQSYATIKNYEKFIDFNSKEDKELYLAPNQVTKTSKMLSVIDVWKDYFAGLHDGRGFVFWIIISILVDAAAFIFFDIAFKKRED